MNKQKTNAYFSILMLSAVSFSVHAHTGDGSIQGFFDGFMHPWLGVDHLLAMSAIGIWAAVTGGRRLWLLPTVFLLAMAAGALLKFAGITINGADTWVAFSVLVLGVILSFNRHMSTLLATGLSAAFALGHGYAHAAEIGNEANVATYALGFLTATAVLHGTGMAAGLSGPAALKAIRTAFGLICALAGVVLLAGV